jgi:6-phosphogluconate dehydrogenase
LELGMIGLGRMGSNMVERLVNGGHRVVGYSRTAEKRRQAVEKGALEAKSLPALAAALSPPRVVWLMVPHPAVDEVVEELSSSLTPADVVVDGGNSFYKDSVRRAAQLASKNIHFVDVGTSGGVWGLTEGYSMMVGGEKMVVEQLRPIFETLAPAPDRGWGHVGPPGAGHFVKMIHNGIEYGLMQAYAEGFGIMERKKEFDLDCQKVAEIWCHGSVIRSWLLELTAQVMAESPKLDDVAPYVEDSGEGRWTVLEAIELDQSAPIITMALLQRLRSRDQRSFPDRLLAALRNQFGGHDFKAEE